MDHHVERILSAAYTQNVDLKEWVRTERTRRGWTQERLADEAGLDRVEVNALEKGRNKGSSARIRDALTRVFGSIPPELGGATPVLAVVPDPVSMGATLVVPPDELVNGLVSAWSPPSSFFIVFTTTTTIVARAASVWRRVRGSRRRCMRWPT